MAKDLALLDRRVRGILNDTDSSNYAVTNEGLEAYANAGVQWLADFCGIGQTNTAVAVPLVAGTDAYIVTVPGGKTGFLYVDDLILVSQNWQLRKRSPDWIQAAKTGPGGAANLKGDPTDYCLVRLSDQTYQLTLFLTPHINDTLMAVTAEIPNQLSYDTDMAAVLPFTNAGFEALALYCAGLGLSGMSQDAAKRFQKDKSGAQALMTQATALATVEANRVASQFLEDTVEAGDR